jgi:hypothetical protein
MVDIKANSASGLEQMHDKALWENLAPFDLFKSRVVLTVYFDLTDAELATVRIMFLDPEAAGTRTIATSAGKDLNKTILDTIARAKDELPRLIVARQEAIQYSGAR